MEQSLAVGCNFQKTHKSSFTIGPSMSNPTPTNQRGLAPQIPPCRIGCRRDSGQEFQFSCFLLFVNSSFSSVIGGKGVTYTMRSASLDVRLRSPGSHVGHRGPSAGHVPPSLYVAVSKNSVLLMMGLAAAVL